MTALTEANGISERNINICVILRSVKSHQNRNGRSEQASRRACERMSERKHRERAWRTHKVRFYWNFLFIVIILSAVFCSLSASAASRTAWEREQEKKGTLKCTVVVSHNTAGDKKCVRVCVFVFVECNKQHIVRWRELLCALCNSEPRSGSAS